jgi:hypothetical protein
MDKYGYNSRPASLFATHARTQPEPMRQYYVWWPGDAAKVLHYLTPAQADQFREAGYRVEEK